MHLKDVIQSIKDRRESLQVRQDTLAELSLLY